MSRVNRSVAGYCDHCCRKCHRRFGWPGSAAQAPPCPRCKTPVPSQLLEDERVVLAGAWAEIEADREEDLDRRAFDPDAPPLVLQFDGCCYPNDARDPQALAAWAWALVGPAGGRSEAAAAVARGGPRATHDVAAYHALGRCLRWLSDPGAAVYLAPGRPAVLRGDSQLIVRQINGQWESCSDALRPLRDRCRELLAVLCGRGHSVVLECVPRDGLSAVRGLAVEVWEAKTGLPFPAAEAWPAVVDLDLADGTLVANWCPDRFGWHPEQSPAVRWRLQDKKAPWHELE